MKEAEVAAIAKKILTKYEELFKIPTVSAQNKDIKQTAEFVKKLLAKLGAKIIKEDNEFQHPAIFAFFAGKGDKTLLFYNHYDVQPVEPLSAWQTEPFTPTFKEDKLFGRGTADDKGDLVSRLSVISYFNRHGGLPCNVKFLIEGEEEIGSPHMIDYLNHFKKDLVCDAVIWEGGGLNEAEQFQIWAGCKGAVSFNIEAQTAASDAHSSMAAYLDNAAWRLVQGLASLYGPDRQIKVAHFADDVKPLTTYEEQTIKEEEQFFKPQNVVKNLGVKSKELAVADPYYALMNEPTLTINSLEAGYQGPGAKTIVPCKAVAKLDCRLLPGQKPHKVVSLIQKQLAQNGFGDLKVKYNLGEEAFRTDLKDPFVQLAYQVAQQEFTKEKAALVINQPSSGPMKTFYETVKAPIIGVGVRYAACAQHAPNENIRLIDFGKATIYLQKLLTKFGQ